MKIFIHLYILLTLLGSSDALLARAGRGGSVGRSGSRSGYSSRSYSEPRRQAPEARPVSPQQPFARQAEPAPQSRSSFSRGLLGGLAGGFLGTALFSTLGFGRGGLYGGGGGGGIGLIEILLFAGIIYFIFRYMRRRNQGAAADISQPYSYAAATPSPSWQRPDKLENHTIDSPAIDTSQFRLMDSGEGIPESEASDIFFRVQAAWSKRDIQAVKDNLSLEVFEHFVKDIDSDRQQKRINKLENISIQKTQILENFQEAGVSYSRVYILAYMLDYIIDETSGKVLDGSDLKPIKFEEEWTFQKSRGATVWQLCEINPL